MARKTIFLETAFWDSFSECFRDLFNLAAGGDPAAVCESISRWNDLYKFLCRSSVVVDTPLGELAEKAKRDQMLRSLLKSNGDGRMELEYQPAPFPNPESDDRFDDGKHYDAIFITRNDHRDASRLRGVINISSETVWDQDNKFKDTGEAIEADEEWAWNRMNILRECSNGMVIVDNFILTPGRGNGQCTLKYNLKELLRLMLPERCKGEYVVSIFYYDDSQDKEIMKERKEQFYDSIMNYVGSRKRHLNFTLELFPTSHKRGFQKEFHDRAIVTNNVWIGSEAGFDLLVYDRTRGTNARAIKTTKTHGLYLGFGTEAASWLEDAYEQLISDAKQCLRKYRYTTRNRLLL